MKILKLTCALLMTAWVSVSHAAVIHVIDANGNLLGAKNVLVGGTLHDVAFLDGTCRALYNGCFEADNFIFNNRAAATMASQALLDTVFVDSLYQRFDYNPELTNGCESVNLCLALTPWVTINVFGGRNSVITSVARNNAEAVLDVEYEIRPFTNYDTVDTVIYTYAVWTPATVVPEPSTVILLSLGLAGLSFVRYRKQY
jgi:hypothetical protein